MKKIILLLLVLSSIQSFGQAFLRSNSDRGFTNMIKNGIVYINTGEEAIDTVFASALKNYWKCSKFRIIDKTAPLYDDDIVLYDTKLNGKIPVLCLAKAENYKKTNAQISKTYTIGYMQYSGFYRLSEKNTLGLFLNEMIVGLNDLAEIIATYKIYGRGPGFYRSVMNRLSPKSKALKNKTLLILIGNADRINFDDLDAAGIKYKKVTLVEYKNIIESKDYERYCVFYFSSGIYTDISIFDLAEKELIFNIHYPDGRSRLTKGNISQIKREF